MTKENKPSPGARQYALGMGLLIAPKAMSELYVPELFDGTNDVQEQAMAVITESSRLAVYGLIDILERTRCKLGVNTISELRPVRLRPSVDEVVQSEFDCLYSSLEAGSSDSLNKLPEAFKVTRYNPFSASGILIAMTHHKNKLTPGELSGPLPVPSWIRRTGLLEESFGSLGIGLRKKT